MPFIIKPVDTLALKGDGLARSVYKWLSESYSTSVSRSAHNLDVVDARKGSLGFAAGVLDANGQPRLPSLRSCTHLKNADVALIDISVKEILSPRFEFLLCQYLESSQKLKLIFFPRLELPARSDTNNLTSFVRKATESLAVLNVINEISKKYPRIDFFPIYQLAFYLGLRTQAETGKNYSLEFIGHAKKLFYDLYILKNDFLRAPQEKLSLNSHIGNWDFIGDSHILNILESINLNNKARSLIMNGSEWDALNFKYTKDSISLRPKYTRALSNQTSLKLPNFEKKILLTNIGNHSHCLHERLIDAMQINNIRESDPRYLDFVGVAIRNYRLQHFELLRSVRARYSRVVVISDPPLQHFRIYEDGRKHEKTYRMIDSVCQTLAEESGCLFLNLREIIVGTGKEYDFLSNKTISPHSDEIDWVHGNTDYYKFAWLATVRLIEKLKAEETHS